MFGKNKIVKPDFGDGEILKIVDIFHTFQGEGIYAGQNSVFIRLGGCNLACKFCDTEFDDFYEMKIVEIIEKVENLSKTGKNKTKLIIITGGEPFLQEISPLCQKLLNLGYKIQIESNGTIFRKNLPENIDIICSPKNANGKYYQIHPELLKRISAFKFLVAKNDEKYQEIPNLGQDELRIPVFLQPIDEYDKQKNQENQKLTLELAKKYGYNISLQIHKILDID